VIHYLILFVLLALTTSAQAGITITSGEIAKDFSSVSLVINVTGASEKKVKVSGDLNDLKNNLKIYFGQESEPIRMTRGSTEDGNLNDFFYWDSANMTPTKTNINGDLFDVEFRVTIYSNPEIASAQTLLSKSTDQKTIVFKAEWKKYNRDLPTPAYEHEFDKTAFTAAVVFAAPDEVPEITSVVGSNRALKIKWASVSNVTYTDGISRPAPNVHVTLVLKEGNQNVDFGAESYIANIVDATNDAQGGGCTLDPNASNCLTCDTNGYLKADAMAAKAAGSGGMISFKSFSPTGGEALITDLKPETTYIAFLQYDRGLKRSVCATGEPILDVSFADKSGEKPAGYGTPTCFVASVAYGSRIHPFIDHLRWLRDAYLLKFELGKSFVAWYYKNGSDLAEVVGSNRALKLAAQVLLLPPIAAAYALKSWGPWPVGCLFLGLIFTFGMLALRSRSEPKPFRA
jgi:hypothetical protein